MHMNAITERLLVAPASNMVVRPLPHKEAMAVYMDRDYSAAETSVGEFRYIPDGATVDAYIDSWSDPADPIGFILSTN
jgi:hypothetical protein